MDVLSSFKLEYEEHRSNTKPNFKQGALQMRSLLRVVGQILIAIFRRR